jgi:hypothetical protein
MFPERSVTIATTPGAPPYRSVVYFRTVSAALPIALLMVTSCR